MTVSLHRSRRSIDIWPGFVDALATLLMVIIFLLMIFVIAQFFLTDALSGRDAALRRLQGQVSELAELLALEQATSADLTANVNRLTTELQASLARSQELSSALQSITVRAEQAERQVESLQSALGEEQTARAADQETLKKQSERLVRLANDIAALEALKQELEKEVANLAGETEEAEAALLAEQEISQSARAQIALLNQQTAALRQQVEQLNAALEASEALTKEQEVQITNLGQRLNAALASKVQELTRYRSEFFGKLREVLGDRAGIRVVGDRFVFQSEVLFDPGSAALGPQGREQILKVAQTLTEISEEIPPEIDWVLQVEGHTDRIPIQTSIYPSNWELSAARAISVIRLLIEAGLPPSKLSAAGFGEFRPIDPGDDASAYSRNRRIELKLTQR
ncbi:MAG: peptidoglycan -binding protein [Hyphomicrobiales bacterium]|nr:peptidoglycan -binding protein [Hyphomicrobiales bacterium]